MVNFLDLEETEKQFRTICEHKSIVIAIENLEKDSLSAEEQVAIIKEVKSIVEDEEKSRKDRKYIFEKPWFFFFRQYNVMKAI